jgi:hypothetical protein
MADYSSTNIPAPKDWQAFERKIRLLFEHSLGDPHTQNNGRIGQPQHGVDVYGRRGGPSGHYVGVQCKGKDANYGGRSHCERFPSNVVVPATAQVLGCMPRDRSRPQQDTPSKKM